MNRAQATRRRFLTILGSVSAAGLIPSTYSAFATETKGVLRWSGRAMGADASMVLAGLEPEVAQDLFSACAEEIDRLEGLFSLYRPGSTVSKLNRDGSVAGAPQGFIALMRMSREISELTGGVFDPTVQPLWRLYADHFADSRGSEGPAPAEIERVRDLVGYRGVKVDGETVSFARPGMAMTLNGIAQGYITDRVTALLKEVGVGHVLVNMGEYAAIGSHPDGAPWRVGIRDPRNPFAAIEAVPLMDAALATSGGYGTVFDRAGRFHHLFNPRTGASAARYASVSVGHRSAAWADGLSTAFSAMSKPAISSVLAQLEGATAILVGNDGEVIRLG